MRLIFLLPACLLAMACEPEETPLFRKIDPVESGILFANDLKENDSQNIIDYEYFYNGSGIAIGDINNDGLEDLFFGANQSGPKLYLNEGGLKFRDITDAARVNSKQWVTGVTMADVNADGYLDIYASVAGSENPEERANLLYINNKDLTFTESASAYGLADTRFATQSAFFDYDLDGDLDCYVMNHSSKDRDAHILLPIDTTGSSMSTDRLYRNNGDNTFTDVSRDAGITVEGYGLGLLIHDVNDDGWPDVFVANDYIYNDLLYINNGNGTFTESARRYFKHTSLFSMGTDFGDLDGDGHDDLMVMDMLPPDNYRRKLLSGAMNYKRHQMAIEMGYMEQFMKNTVQLKNPGTFYSEAGQYTGMYATDWSWSVLLQDYDNDGDNDAYITNGYVKNITDLDFAVYANNQKGGRVNEGPARQNLKDTLKNLNGALLSNAMYENKGRLKFKQTTKEWGMNFPSFSNGAAYADLDRDGDLEMVVNNINSEAFLFENTGTPEHSLSIRLQGPQGNLFAEGARVTVYTGGHALSREKRSVRGYQSSVSQYLHFGLGMEQQADSIKVTWPDRSVQVIKSVPSDTTLDISYSPSRFEAPVIAVRTTSFLASETPDKLPFLHKESNFQDFDYQHLLPKRYSRRGPFMVVEDVNNDSLQDVYVGGAAGQAGTLFFQKPNGTFAPYLFDEAMYEDQEAVFHDLNGDGFKDLIVLSGSYEFFPNHYKLANRVYINNQGKSFSRDLTYLPEGKENSSCIALSDYNEDGYPDLFIGGYVYPSKFPLPAKSILLSGGPEGFRDISSQVEGLDRLGMVTDALWTDYNQDGQTDLIITGEFMSPVLYENISGVLTRRPLRTGISLDGMWNTIEQADFNRDGRMDYVLGNLGENSFYSGSEDYPVKVYAADFDNNGSIDPIITTTDGSNEYPVASRDMYTQQLTYLKKKFGTYESFARTTLNDLFTNAQLTSAYQRKIDFSKSVVLLNLGDGEFSVVDLPLDAQLFPVTSINVCDLNDDGSADLIVAGNNFNMDVTFGPVTAGNGCVLLGNGDGTFSGNTEKGLRLPGNVADIEKIRILKDSYFIVSVNNDSLKLWRIID